MAEPAACLHVLLEGRVQGVGFRAFVQDHAHRLGLTGWVRNVRDDQVEVWAEGPQDKLDQLLNRLRLGPRAAFVSNVRMEPGDPKGSYQRFQIAPSSW